MTMVLACKSGPKMALVLCQEHHRGYQKYFELLADGIMDGLDCYLRLPSPRFSQEQTVLGPVVAGGRDVLSRPVQEPPALGQAVHDIIKHGLLMWQKWVQLIHRLGVKTAYPAVHHLQAPQVKDVMQREHKGHDGR